MTSTISLEPSQEQHNSPSDDTLSRSCCARFVQFINNGWDTLVAGLIHLINCIRNCFCRSVLHENSLLSTPSSLRKEINSSIPVKPHESDVTAEEFFNYLNDMRPKLDKDPSQALAKIKKFLERGGILRILDKDRCLIPIDTNVPVITGCSAGINRSQVTAVVMKKMGIKVHGVLPGKLMKNNGGHTYGFDKMPSEQDENGAKKFKEAFGLDKMDQIGRKEVVSYLSLNDESGEFSELYVKAMQNTHQFFQNYINELNATHFITFAESGPFVLDYLLNRPQADLSGFIITYSAWGDEVSHPDVLGITPKPSPNSKEAYLAFADKIERCFSFLK